MEKEAKMAVELRELQTSPRFPARPGSTHSSAHSSTPTTTSVTIELHETDSSEAGGSPQGVGDSPQTPISGGGSNGGDGGGDSGVSFATDNTNLSGKKPSRFSSADFLSRRRKTSDTSSSSIRPLLKSSYDGRSAFKGESLIEKDDKIFTVAAKDVSMLERIAQRAQDRALRIRKPHDVYVELEEIRMDGSEGPEWAETARWIKFEEDVEEGSGRWGRPHISALAFHSLVELQRGLDKGRVLLDVEGSSFPAVVNEIVVSLVKSSYLPASCAAQLETLLLRKHKHSGDHPTLWDRIRSSAADGALHQIGEGLRRKGSSANVLDTHSHAQSGEAAEGGSNHHVPAVTVTLDKRATLSEFPLLQEDNNEEPIVDDSLAVTPRSNSPSDQNSTDHISRTASPDSINHTPYGSTHHVESREGGVESPSGGLRSRLHRRRGGGSLISKIPDEAESLTVLVGGVKFLKEPISVFVRLNEGLICDDVTAAQVPLRFLFLQIGPDDQSIDYHEVGRAMATLMSDAHFHEVAYSAERKEDLIDGMDEFLDNSLVLPPGDWGEDLLLPAVHERHNLRRRKEDHKDAVESYQKMVTEPLKHSRRPCGGMWRDLKNLAIRYPSDFIDALTPKVILSIIFLYITLLAPAIAFGGLIEEQTNTFIGETETLLATGLGGILYGLFSVQPLTILAFTGPVLVYEAIIFDFSQMLDIPYIEWRMVIGLWLMVILMVLAVCELSFLVHHFTRFSEEIFTGIVAVIFIWEAGLSIFHVFERNPLCGLHHPCGEAAHFTNTCLLLEDHHHGNDSHAYNETDHGSGLMSMMKPGASSMMMDDQVNATFPRGFRICNQPNTGFLSMTLALGTFVIALLLRKLRFKKFLGKKTRRLVSDFGILVAITTMVLVAFLLRDLVTVETLLVPPNYSVSNATARSWITNPFNGSLSIWAGVGAIVPGFLMAVLIFVENQEALITINHPEHKLRKPVGYHMDLFLVGILAGICGVLGIPFLCGAPVRSLQHLQMLSVYTKKQAPGERPRLIKIHEQRVTAIVVHMFIIVTPFASTVMQNVPISVTLGVFIYLGYVSLAGVQMTTRLKLLFMLPKHHPDEVYVKKVRTWKMHVYTLVQVACIGVLYAIKLSPGALAYPLIIIILLPLRWILGKIYTKEEIEALDNEVDKERDEEKGEFATTRFPY